MDLPTSTALAVWQRKRRRISPLPHFHARVAFFLWILMQCRGCVKRQPFFNMIKPILRFIFHFDYVHDRHEARAFHVELFKSPDRLNYPKDILRWACGRQKDLDGHYILPNGKQDQAFYLLFLSPPRRSRPPLPLMQLYFCAECNMKTHWELWSAHDADDKIVHIHDSACEHVHFAYGEHYGGNYWW